MIGSFSKQQNSGKFASIYRKSFEVKNQQNEYCPSTYSTNNGGLNLLNKSLDGLKKQQLNISKSSLSKIQ